MTDSELVVVRRAIGADAPQLARMRWADSTEAGTPSPQAAADFCREFEAFVRRAVAERQPAIWVAEVAGRVEAHLYVHVVERVPRPGRFERRWGYVSAVNTTPDERNRGIGSALLRHVVEWAMEERLESLALGPSERSVRFYERAGFVRSPDTMELQLDI
jgi:GNAT superfamily N-acetyltransferase